LFVLVISVIKKVQNSALTGKCGEKNNFNKHNRILEDYELFLGGFLDAYKLIK